MKRSINLIINKINKTPLSPVRFLMAGILTIFVLVLVIQMVTDPLGEKDLTVFIGIIMTLLILLGVVELNNQRRWIKQTVVIRLRPNQEEVALAQRSKTDFDKTWIYGLIAISFPILASVIILGLIIEPLIIFLLSFGLVAASVIWLVSRRVNVNFMKKEPEIILSKVGMIYIHECILWADHFGSRWIESGQVESSEGKTKLILKIGKAYRYMTTYKTYTLFIPTMSVSEVSNLLMDILSSSVRSRSIV